jgi:O-antigen/teichoic acid export membrane protein
VSENKQRGFLWNTSVYLISTAFSVVVTIIVLPVYTRFLSPADYGVVALFVMFGNLTAGVISVNLHFASFRYYFQFKNDREKLRTICSTNALAVILIFLIFGVLIYFIAGWLSSFLFQGRLMTGLIFLSFVGGCLEYLILYLTTLLTAEVRSAQYAAIIIARIVLNTAFSFYFIFCRSMTYLALIYALLLSQTVTLGALLAINRELFALRFSWTDLKMSLQLAFPLVPNSMVGLLYSSFDKTMLNKYKSTESVGYYSFGERFSVLLKMLQDGVAKSWDPYFMNKAHENTATAREAIIKRFYEISFLFMIIGLCIIYYSEEMIKILTTKAYYPSMYVVPIYVYFYLFAIIATLAMNQVSFSKKMGYLLPVSIMGVVINMTLNIILIPRYGAIGAACAIAASALSNNLMLLYFGMKLYPLPLGKWRLLGMYLLLIGFTAPVYLLMPVDCSFLFKVMIKAAIIILFALIGILLHYVSRSSLKHVFGKIRGAATSLAGI